MESGLCGNFDARLAPCGEAPLLREIGNLWTQENLVMTYRTTERRHPIHVNRCQMSL